MSLEEPKPSNKTAWIEHLNTKEGVQENFEEAKEFIEHICGIRLTQIELVGLRRIAVKVMEEMYKQEKTYEQEKIIGTATEDTLSNINHMQETPSRFFQEFYNINPSEINKLHGENDLEIFKEYFRRMQANAHRP